MAENWDSDVDEEFPHHELRSDPFWGRLVAAVSRAATAASSNDYDRRENIQHGLYIVETLARSVNEKWWDRTEGQPICPWRHRSNPYLTNKKRLDPYIIRIDVEEAAADYLALDYRVDALDRLLMDMLMAAEMFAFADEVQPQLKQKLPTSLAWLWGNLKSLVVGLAVAAFILWLAPTSAVAQWSAGIVGGLTLLGTLFSIVVFPFFYPAVRDQRQKFNATVMGMLDAYRTLNGSPASVPHIRKMVDRATDVGVVWPAPLMALLDDVEERRKAI